MVSYMSISLHILPVVLVCFIYTVKSSQDTDAANLDTLRLVQILYRHGDRTPTRSYPTDPYWDISKYWPQGIGQLTNIGKIQHYNLGKYFRKRYDGFLSRHYTPQEIYVLASDMDRCIMSADMNLAGLYEPMDSNTNWNPTIPWTPVPVRTIPSKEDTLLRTSKPCPKYKRLYRELLQSKVVEDMNRENQAFVQYVLQNAGAEGSTIRDIVGIEDVLQVDRFHNYTLPIWANETILEKFHKLAAQHFALGTSTIEMKRLKGGPLWKEFLKNMQNIVSESRNRKVHVYSAHDSTLIRLLNTIKVYDEIMPTYAAAFIVELHEENKDYFVQMFYRNETNRSPYELKVPGCSDPCYLSKLIELTAPVVPEDLESECEDLSIPNLSAPILNKPNEDSEAMARAFLIVGGLFLTISLLLYISRKKVNFQLFTYRMPLPRRVIPHAHRGGYETI